MFLKIWHIISGPIVGPWRAAAILREIENLDELIPVVLTHERGVTLNIVKLRLRHRIGKILGIR